MPDVAIFGGPGSGAIVAETVRRLTATGRPIGLAGFLNDMLPRGENVAGTRVIGDFASWRALAGETAFVAPLHKAKQMDARVGRVRELEIPDARWATVVDPDAAVASDAAIGCGSFAGPFAVVDVSVRLGRHVALWPAAQIAHESIVEDFVFAGRGSVVSGRCRIGLGAYIGPRAVILEDLRIGSFAVVAAGAVVIADVPDRAIVAGNPARIIGHSGP